jgi:hypothetical protein
VHNEASLSSGLNSEKAMYLSYMISRAFIPPWSLVMRDRKLSDQTLRVTAAGTLVSPFSAIVQSCVSKVTELMVTVAVTSSAESAAVDCVNLLALACSGSQAHPLWLLSERAIEIKGERLHVRKPRTSWSVF